MGLPPRTKVDRPDLADSTGGDRIGYVAPPGHYPVVTDGEFLGADDMPNPRTREERDPPDDSGDWVVVAWKGEPEPDGTPSWFYRWEYAPRLRVLAPPKASR
ncbi:hypothetical protein [Nocardia sp. CC201C]|uniref:hypothetical protein n=1 Tax=Nocardia sp. CC201C TaxID=3044575 RepID=UPI0024A849C0|nr:hypothetical protein [Nocardia sp. CC201C]